MRTRRERVVSKTSVAIHSHARKVRFFFTSLSLIFCSSFFFCFGFSCRPVFLFCFVSFVCLFSLFVLPALFECFVAPTHSVLCVVVMWKCKCAIWWPLQAREHDCTPHAQVCTFCINLDTRRVFDHPLAEVSTVSALRVLS